MKKLLERDYWENLRDETSVSGSVGRWRCDFWVHDILNLVGESIDKIDILTTFHGKSLVENGFSFHTWLEIVGNGKRFIADGTAGSFHDDYPMGFYGFLEEAPKLLKDIYNSY